MLPDLDASFVLNYLQNPTPDDVVALEFLLHDVDTPFLNIDPEQTLDPIPNDPLTTTVPSPTVPSPTNRQSSHASLPKIVVPYKNDRESTTLHYGDRDYTLKYARKRKGSLHGGVSHELVPENSVFKPILVEQKTTQVSTLCSNNRAIYRVSTCTPPPSTRVARSRVIRSSPSLTAELLLS